MNAKRQVLIIKIVCFNA